jgi:sugar O-acyltransferase (sialic acid O-acetyltransferase NeuD family)
MGCHVTGTVIFGCGGHGRVIADILRCANAQITGFLDDRMLGGTVDGLAVIGDRTWLESTEFLIAHELIIGIGDNRIRRALSEQVLTRGGKLCRAIHPTAVLARDVEIGTGSVVMAGAIINTGSRIGRFAVVNTGAIVDHDNIVADGVHISPGCKLAGGVECGADAFIGTGASIIPRVRIGERAVIAAGSVVIGNVPVDVLVAGCPAVVKKSLAIVASARQ